jgi:hypothetical protein
MENPTLSDLCLDQPEPSETPRRRHWGWLLCYALVAFSVTLATGWSVDRVKGRFATPLVAPAP